MTDDENALAVMHAHLEALNQRDPDALAATLHFPHYRLSGTQMKIWQDSSTYFEDFLSRAGGDWGYTKWGKLEVIASSAGKVHIRAVIERYREDDSLLTSFESLWVITKIDGRWAAHLRSSFAAR